jgi:beta-lactamase regulating signal transducer with metallopeptidase domain
VLIKMVTPPCFDFPLDVIHDNAVIVAGNSAAFQTASGSDISAPQAAAQGQPENERPDVEFDMDNSFLAFAAGDQSTRRWWRLAAGSIWLAGFLFLTLLTIVRTVRFGRGLRYATPASDSIQTQASKLSRRMGLRRRPDILVSNSRIPPLLWWPILRPVVVLPAGLLKRLNADERLTLLAHELAHYRSGDHLVRWFDTLVVSLYWWNPVAWWARGELHKCEEDRCDRYVVTSIPEHTKSYARAVLATSEFLSGVRSKKPAMASGFGQSVSLTRRIEMILEKGVRRWSWLHRVVLLLVAFVVLPVSVNLWGQEPVPEEKAAASKIASLGGWCEIDGRGYVVKVNMNFRLTADGRRINNSLDSDKALAIIPQFTKLQKLTLKGTQATDEGLRHLAGMTSLREVRLLDSRLVTDAGISHLKDCRDLEVLQVLNSQIGDESLRMLRKMPNLISLNLAGTQITDKGLRYLSKLSRLEILRLSHTRVTDEGLSYLIDLPLKTLGLIRCAITDAGAAHIAKLSNLEVLLLGWTRVTDLGLLNFVDLPLKEIGLSRTRITDAGAVDLSEISTLENLLIGMTPLTDASLVDLSRLEGLKSISLPYSISADARKQLQLDRPKLIVSFWFETNIEGKSYLTLGTVPKQNPYFQDLSIIA